MTELDLPITRVYENKVLEGRTSSITGTIAKHVFFKLKKEFRGDKIAQVLHNRELKAYKKNKFSQIHLNAAWQGKVIWPRAPFGFTIINPKHERDILLSWRIYLKEIVGISDPVELGKICIGIKSVKTIPKEYIIHTDGKISFAEWYDSKSVSKNVPMYKNIDGFKDAN